MAYSQNEMEPLKARIESALNGGSLTSWQRQFLNDIDDRIERYGRNVRFSDKQVSKLYEILSSPSHRSAPQPERRPTHRPVSASFEPGRQRAATGAIARVRRWFGQRTHRDVTLLALLMISFFYVGYRGISFPELGSHFSSASPVHTSRPITMSDFTITDGDTIRLNGEPQGTRLVGFNTPETFKPQCSEERALGLRAKARLRQLLSNGASLELQRVPCSCTPGTERTKACNHGRSCAILRTDGRDVGQVLIAEGLAAPLVCGATSCPPTPRPWCS